MELGLGLVRVRGSIATSAPAAPCRAVQPLKLAMVASAPDASRDCTCSSAPGVENARLRNAGRASAFPWALRAREGEREGEQTPECPSCGAPKGHLQRAAPPASAARISAVSPLSSTAAVRTGAAENVRLVNGWRWWWGRRRAPCVSTTRSAIRTFTFRLAKSARNLKNWCFFGRQRQAMDASDEQMKIMAIKLLSQCEINLTII